MEIFQADKTRNGHGKEQINQQYAEEKDSPITWREVRRLYKVSLEQIHQQWAKEIEKHGDFQQDLGDQCLRCMLITNGNILISDNQVWVCKMEIPEGRTLCDEESALGSIYTCPKTVRMPTEDHFRALAITTALGATLGTRYELLNFPFPQRVKLRQINVTPKSNPSSHACVIPKISTRSTQMRLKVLLAKDTLMRYAVIYAPPGFGKTTFQKQLAKRGVFVLDTDDIPGMTVDILKKTLLWTTVLTNRIDLLDPNLPTVAFVPYDVDVLIKRSRLQGLTESDWDYWMSHHNFSAHVHALICRVRNSNIFDWFRMPDVDVDQCKPSDVGDMFNVFLEKIGMHKSLD